MHFDFTISIGNLITLGFVGLGMFRMDRLASKFLVEHEILISDYCSRIIASGQASMWPICPRA